MKKVLVATDFSANAEHAAAYGLAIARQIKADLVLCNAFIVPAEIPEASTMAWPQYEYEELSKDSAEGLKELENSLKNSWEKTDFQPLISRISKDGTLAEIINKAVADDNVGLVVMGTHGNTGLSGVIMGNHSRCMIDEAVCPLLLVPKTASAAPIKKVAFATDFKEPDKDLNTIFGLIPLLQRLNSELLLTHIYNDANQAFSFKEHIEPFLTELSNKANYPHIYYRIVKSDKPEKGLDWLCHFGHVDMLAMVHRKHSFFDRILTGSHTQKIANHISVPLLVLPGK